MPQNYNEATILIPIKGGTISQLKIALYTPFQCKIRGDILLFSGMKRNNEDYRNAIEATAQKLCLKIYSPYFDKKHFPVKDYQRGGRALNIIPSFLSWIKLHDGNHIPYFIIGHSAGGQFLERLIAYHPPLGIQKFIVISPSSYVFPSLKVKEPYGFLNHSQNDIKTYLQQPLAIFVGANEYKNTNHLLHNKDAMMQGRSRLERAQKIFSYAKKTAEKRITPFNWSLFIMPDIGHDFRKALNSEDLKELLENTLISFEKHPI